MPPPDLIQFQILNHALSTETFHRNILPMIIFYKILHMHLQETDVIGVPLYNLVNISITKLGAFIGL